MSERELLLRRLRYRLQTLGMLELEVWLSVLVSDLAVADEVGLTAVDELLRMEVPDLLAMMEGRKSLPPVLQESLLQ